MNGHIYFVGGNRGGVGKSIVTMAVLDFLRSHPVLLAETDTCTPDVAKAYRGSVPALELIDLDDADGWIALVNICEASAEKTVVVNTAPGNDRGVGRFSAILTGALPELRRKLTTLWVINRQRDSLQMLSDYMDVVRTGQVHVIRNGYFGCADHFELYNGSKLRARVEANGGHSLSFPVLADQVADILFNKRLPIGKALDDKTGPLNTGQRGALRAWRTEVGAVLRPVFSQ